VTVYVDDARIRARIGTISARWSHLMADDSAQLLAFAARLGLHPHWIQHPATWKEHFDVTDRKRSEALRLGAVEIRYGREGAALGRAKRAGLIFDLDSFRASSPGASDQLF
jgi:hypothetical protein